MARIKTYRVEDVITEVGVAYVQATSKAEVRRMVDRGELKFTYDGSADFRRGDGIHVYVERGGQ